MTMNDFQREISGLISSLPDSSPTLKKAVEYAVIDGGKRIRPSLCFLSAAFCDVPDKKVLPLALAIECIHSYSLIHDDMPCMDNDAIRRGKPTVHVKFGESMALLAGDALLNLAYEVLFSACVADPDLLPSCKLIADCAGADGMIGGQALEFDDPVVDEEFLYVLDGKKTGKLIECAVLSAALLSYDNKKISALSAFSGYAGLAFQLADDLLDQDKGEKTNFVTICGKEKTEELLNALYRKAERVLSPWAEDAADLLAFFRFLAFRKV